MGRTLRKQHNPKSCGAACSLVAAIELGDGLKNDDTQEDAIYNAVKIPSGSPVGADEVLPSSLVAYLGTGHTAEILESPDTTKVLVKVTWALNKAMQGMYALYDGVVTASGCKRGIRDIKADDLKSNGHLILVVKFALQDKLHYLLAREDSSKCYIMNPDPGTDEAISLPKVGGAIKTNVGNPIGDPYGERDYTYMGIAVHVK